MPNGEKFSDNTYVKKLSKVEIASGDVLKVCITNGIIEVIFRRKECIGGIRDIVKIDKDHYKIVSTGEIRKYAHSEECGNGRGIPNDRRKSMNRKLTYLRRFINMNFTCEDCESHMVLTYGEPVKELEKVKNDFKKFWKRFIYKNGKLEYIAVYEPHKNGAWHVHVLVKDEKGGTLNLQSKEIEKIWNNGFVKITKIKNNDNVGAYFCDLMGKKELLDKKKKSGRLDYYPLYAKIYTSSKGMKKPTLLSMNYEEVKEIIGDRKPCFERGYSIRLQDTHQEVSFVGHLTYNDKRNPHS